MKSGDESRSLTSVYRFSRRINQLQSEIDNNCGTFLTLSSSVF